jgi:hypothetical protein
VSNDDRDALDRRAHDIRRLLGLLADLQGAVTLHYPGTYDLPVNPKIEWWPKVDRAAAESADSA